MTTKLDNWQRIERIIKWVDTNINSFARSVGLPRGENLYQIKKGNYGISRDLADKIVRKYPQINLLWLLTGEGQMFVSEEVALHTIPFYDLDMEKYVASVSRRRPAGYIAIPNFEDCDLAMLYSGTAMNAFYPAGTIVLLRKTDREAIIPGNDYLVVTKNIVTLRRIRREPGSAMLRLEAVSDGPYDDMLLAADDLKQLYLVRGLVINREG